MPLSLAVNPLPSNISGSQLLRKKFAMSALVKQIHKIGVIHLSGPSKIRVSPEPFAGGAGVMAKRASSPIARSRRMLRTVANSSAHRCGRDARNFTDSGNANSEHAATMRGATPPIQNMTCQP
jgi:hypothetical protein